MQKLATCYDIRSVSLRFSTLLAEHVQVLDALHLSRATFSKIQQNLCWAFAYNLVGIPLAAGVLLPTSGIALTPSIAGGPLVSDAMLRSTAGRLTHEDINSDYTVTAGALMGASSLAVMANSLLLQRTTVPAGIGMSEEVPQPEAGSASV